MLRKLRLSQKNGFLKKKRLLVFILSLSQEKLVTKFFKKLKKKKLFWGYFRPFFSQISAKMFRGKRALSVFKCFNYLHWCKNSEETNDSFLRKTLKRQFKQSGPILISGNELFENHFQFLNQGLLLGFCFWKQFGKMLNPALTWTFFLLKSDQEFITGVWNTELWPCAYMRLSNKYFQYLALTRVQHQNFLRLRKLKKVNGWKCDLYLVTANLETSGGR